MKFHYWVLILSALALSVLLESRSDDLVEISTSSQEKTVNDKRIKDTVRWRKTMQELYKTLAEITTDTSSDLRFNDPKNKGRIEKNAKKLADRAHELSTKGVSPDADPTIKILSDLFQDETKRAYGALKVGNRSYARGLLNQVSSYCIACHTKNNSGPSFSSLPLEPTAKTLYPIEQGRFYAATRQYDRALDLFQKIVGDPTAPIERPLEWEQAIRYGLAISIRVKKDHDQARALIERVIGSKKAPFFLKQDALKWKDSVLQWKEELPRRALTEEGLHVEAMQLIAQAREIQKYTMDHSADVLYLRATAVIHELLQKAPEGRYAQDALFMAGICYDTLRPFNFDNIHEIYYEACIKKAPHTLTAESCYRRYEQSTYEGYTGTMGTFLPMEVTRKLQRLETLARPESPSSPRLD